MLSFGKRLRKLRLSRGLVLDELVAKTGLSRPYLSQIETGKASPSLQTVHKLAFSLSVPVTYFFADDGLSAHVIRKKERPVVTFGPPDSVTGQPMRLTMLSAPNRKIEMVILEIPRGYNAAKQDQGHEGEECFLVLSGRIRAEQADRSFTAEEGDSFHWDGTIPHAIHNIGTTPAKLLVARSPPGFMMVQFSGDGAPAGRKRAVRRATPAAKKKR
jgi:mannose-6-phosphate isomerase-like protein (cupin superfamily)/DNA-binding Xre family transcriptional regulator